MTQQESRRLRRPLRMVAREISHTLLVEMSGNQVCDSPPPESVLQLLLQLLHQEVLEQLKTANAAEGPSNEQLADRLAKAERKLERAAMGAVDDDDDEPGTGGASFPNLKYAKPKYQNVDSILRYVEGESERGGVKLVIMNFND